MNDLLPLVWPVMSGLDPVFTPFFTATWPAGALERLIEIGLVNQMHDADTVVCPHCHDHEEAVIALEGPPGRIRLWIPCPDSFRVEIPSEHLRQWTVNILNVVEQLASSLQLVGTPSQVQSDLVWRLGRGTLDGYVHDFLVVRRHDVNQAELQSLCSTLLAPIVLFLREVPRWWQATKFAAASLRDVATCRAERIEIDRTALAMLVSQVEKQLPANTFRRRGEFWELSFAGKPVHIKDSRGLAYIARLLGERDRDVPAVSLLAGLPPGSDGPIASGSLGEVLDISARESYSVHYTELSEELEIALRNNDLGRAEKLQTEQDQLLSELTRATGLGGRSRKQTDADKARRSVTMAVTRDLDRIGKEHPALGEHLKSSIKMGLLFRYAPAEEIPWQTT